jgi:hypothetical protein
MVQSDAKDRENPGKTASTLKMSMSSGVFESFLLIELCSQVAQIQGIPPVRIRATDMSGFLATSHGAI